MKKGSRRALIITIFSIVLILGIVYVAGLYTTTEVGECYDNKDNVIIGLECDIKINTYTPLMIILIMLTFVFDIYMLAFSRWVNE